MDYGLWTMDYDPSLRQFSYKFLKSDKVSEAGSIYLFTCLFLRRNV